jgi:hypothetical protein
MTDERVVQSLMRSACKLGYHIEMTQDGTRFQLIDDWPGKARHVVNNGDAWLTLDQARAKLIGIGRSKPRGK